MRGSTVSGGSANPVVLERPVRRDAVFKSSCLRPVPSCPSYPKSTFPRPIFYSSVKNRWTRSTPMRLTIENECMLIETDSIESWSYVWSCDEKVWPWHCHCDAGGKWLSKWHGTNSLNPSWTRYSRGKSWNYKSLQRPSSTFLSFLSLPSKPESWGCVKFMGVRWRQQSL